MVRPHEYLDKLDKVLEGANVMTETDVTTEAEVAEPEPGPVPQTAEELMDWGLQVLEALPDDMREVYMGRIRRDVSEAEARILGTIPKEGPIPEVIASV